MARGEHRAVSFFLVLAALTTADIDAVRAADQAYIDAWRKNDEAAVMATLWPNAVILPQSNPPRVGTDAIRAFWFQGPVTTVERFESTIEEVDGSSPFAYTRGRFELTFSWLQDGKRVRRSTRGTYLMLFLEKGGRWRISHRMWNGLPPP